MILVTGGARSGKSRFAEQLAEAAGSRRIYIATGKVFDEEMARRVAKHKMRRGDQWQTYEDHRGIDAFLMAQGASYDSGLLDCVTTLLTNLLFDRLGDIPQDYDFSLPDYDSIQADALEYMGRTPLGRAFRDMAGAANQYLAERADTVYFVVSGIPMKIKG